MQTADADPTTKSRPIRLVLGGLLLAVVWYVGSPRIDAPWIQGDEHLFIANNPLVTGVGRSEPFLERLATIFKSVHGDLYQPVPIATYAVEWAVWGEARVAMMRRTDVVIHAANSLLVWLVIAALLRRLAPAAPSLDATLIAFAAALVWAVHPAIAPAYAADMGRTHLLSATFILISCWAQVRAVETQRTEWSVAMIVALALAMLCKVVAGWFVVVLAIEFALCGAAACLRSPRVYLSAILCVAFAAITLWTTKQSGILDDAGLALFGGPVDRALVAIALYAEHLAWPVNLATWYPPDIRTGWSYGLTWLGVLLCGACAVAIWRGAQREADRGVAVGLIWFFAVIGPLLGVVGARVAAAQDRYLYLPLVGLLAAAAIACARCAKPGGNAGPAAIVVAIFISIPLTWISSVDVRDARSTLARAQRVVERYRGDPRALELLAMAYDFSRSHDVPERVAETQPAFARSFVETLAAAAAAAEDGPQHFRDKTDRAAFHRRLSFQLLAIGIRDGSLDQAQRAADFEPDAPFTLTRLAHAYRSLERFEDALKAYRQLETVMPADARFRALRLTEFGDLLLYIYDRPDLAMPRYQVAIESRDAPDRARVGLARCEVLVGRGEEGFRLASLVLGSDPGSVDAMLVIAMYHLRSHNFAEAEEAYRLILRQAPTLYEALRGYSEVVAQDGRWKEAAMAWQTAVDVDPTNPIYRGFLAWTATCAGEEAGRRLADELLAESETHVFACLCRMLDALRRDSVEEAISWVDKAADGAPLPGARELARGETTVRLMQRLDLLGPPADLVRARLLVHQDFADEARRVLSDFAASQPSSPHRALADELIKSMPSTAPATIPTSGAGGN